MYVKGCETVPQSGRTNQLALPSPGVILACRSLPLSCFSPPHPRLHCSDVSTKVTLHRLDFESHKTTTQALLFNLSACNEHTNSEIPRWPHMDPACSSCQEGAYCGMEEPVTLLTVGKPVVSRLVVERLIWHL